MPTLECERRSATARPASFDASTRTVEAVIATTTPVRRRDARGDYLEVLPPDALASLPAEGVPAIDNHRTGSARDVVGRLEAIRVEGDRVIGTIRFSEANDAAGIMQRVADGTVAHVSVGYAVPKWREGRDALGRRTRTAAAWELREVSFTAFPADHNARIRTNGELTMPTDTLEDDAPDTSAASERTRRTEIRSLVRAAGLTPEVADQLIDSDCDLDRAKAELFDAMQSRSRSAPIIRTHGTPDNADPAVIRRRRTDALAYRMGGADKLPDDAAPFMSETLPDMARASLEGVGVSTRGMSRDEVLSRSAAHATSDFPLIVADAAHRTARSHYEAAKSELKPLARKRTLSDFKPSTAIQAGGMGRLLPITENGEITHTTITENGETLQLTAFARGMNVSRELLVNDDLGLLGDLASQFGTAAAQTEADELTDCLLGNPSMSDGLPAFDPARGNIADTPVGLDEPGALTALSEARRAMRVVTDLDGTTRLGLKPKYLVCGPDMETAAEAILAELQPTTTDAVNVFAGKLQLVIEPRIDGKAWFLFADPRRLAGMQYAHLAGGEGPQVQRTEAWDTLGLRYRCFLDFGCGWRDWRAAFHNPGE